MPLEVSDVILSPATVWHSPIGTALPANTLGVGDPWPAGWTQLGFTSAPLSMGYNYETAEPDVQESLAPINRYKTSEGLMLETVIAELQVNIISLAWEGTITTQAAGVGQPGFEQLDIGGSNKITQRQWGFEGSYVDENGVVLPIRLFVWRASATEGGALEWSKTDYIGTPLKIGALADFTRPMGQRLFRMVKITDPAI